MTRLTVLYGHPKDPVEFDRYYQIVHIPIAKRMKGLKGWTIGKCESATPGEETPYYMIVGLYADTRADLEAILATSEGQATIADVPNFASGGFTFMFDDEVVLIHARSRVESADEAGDLQPFQGRFKADALASNGRRFRRRALPCARNVSARRTSATISVFRRRKASRLASVGGRGWGSAVFSTSGSLTPIAIPEFKGWVVGAELSGASWQRGFDDPLMVFSVHAPSLGGTYAKQVHKILDEIGMISSGRELVVGGDFNLTVSHYPNAQRPTCKRDLRIQERLAQEFNLVNCWQEANPDRPLEQTLRWTGDRTTAYHCDGIFVPKSWKDRLRSCVVLAGEEWNTLSDHNPIIAEFQSSFAHK